jgi:chromosome segregation ATPase
VTELEQLELEYDALCSLIRRKTAEHKRTGAELESLHQRAEELERQLAKLEATTPTQSPAS